MFLKYAKKHNCKVHCLGMTRKKILDTVPFDFVDSSSWKQASIYGRIGKRKFESCHECIANPGKANRHIVMTESFKLAMQMQDKYEKKWQGVK